MKAFILIQLKFVFFFLLISQHVFSQVSEGGEPFSYNNLLGAEELVSEKMPFVDVEKLKAEDEKNKDQNIPFRFGHTFNVNYGLTNSGKWDTLANGDRVWKLSIESKGAYSINLTFGKYVLPEGARLFIFNKGKTMHIGAFTFKNNQEDQQFGTRPVKGSSIIVEYYEPKEVAGHGQVVVSKITHAYRDIFFNEAYGYGNSESCQVNVNCPDGAGWEDLKRSVVLILADGGLCSGAVVNNVLQDSKPYVLSAYHCFTGGGSDVSTWVYVFNYESAACSPTTEGPTDQTVSGSTYKAGGSSADFLLVELNSIPPLSYNVYYAGWSNSSTAPPSATGIHHPAGDVKKISTKSSTLSKDDWNSSGTINHWEINGWTTGSTEGGSSGSPLFDSNKRIIGQLHGGTSTVCPGTSKTSLYGALFYSWNTGTTPSTRLRDWLDPGNTGVATLNGGYIGSTPCTTPPSAGTAVTSSSFVCVGSSFTLSLTGSSTGTGLSYQWQSSSNGSTDWTNISAATSYTYTATQTAATYYRCSVTCSGSTAFSTSVLVNMTATPCAYVPVTGNASITTCSGYVYDNGGSGSDYMNNSDGILTIYPSVTGNKIQLEFTSFSLEDDYDYLWIYDGTSTSAPLIGEYTISSPGTVYATNASGALTLRFYSDESVTYPGFAATISCVDVSSLIRVPFSGSNSVTTCSGTVYDHSGTSNYSNNADGILTINPSITGNKIQLAFTSFSLESCCDYLRIYDGTSTSAPLIGEYNSTSSPGTVYATNANGALTLRFDSDGSVTYPGFAATISCLTSIPQADLIIQSPNATPALVPAGNSITVSCSLLNQGTSSSTSSNVGYYLSSNSTWDAGDTNLGTSSGGSLAASASATKSSTITIPSVTTPGSYYVLYFADYSSEVSESNEANNVNSFLIEVTAPASDLIIQTPSATPTSVNAGSLVFVTCYIYNQGSATATSSNVGYYLSSNTTFDGGDVFLNSSTGSGLGVGVSSYRSANLTIPLSTSAGTYYLFYVADYSGTVSESNETNNFQYLTITVTPSGSTIIVPFAGSNNVTACTGTLYDHAVNSNYSNYANGILTISPSVAGNKIQLVFNSFSVESCCDYLQIFDGSSTSASLVGTYTANPGTIYATNANGALTLRFYSDYSTVYSGFSAAISCITLSQSDLTVNSINVSSSSANAGGTVDVNCNVYNQGASAASLSSVGYFLSTDNTWDASDVYLGYTYGGSLSSLATASKAADDLVIPGTTVPGNYYIIFYTDFNGDVSEDSETNNTDYLPITVLDPTGINLPLGGSFNIFPNPTEGEFTIYLKDIYNTEKVTITIYNTLGLSIDSRIENIVSGNLASRIDLSEYASGVYSIKVELDNHQTILKVVLE